MAASGAFAVLAMAGSVALSNEILQICHVMEKQETGEMPIPANKSVGSKQLLKSCTKLDIIQTGV